MGPTDDTIRRLDEGLGEAALDPSRWGAVLAMVSGLVGGDGAMLLQSHQRAPGVPCTPEIDDLVADYFRHGWHMRDLRTRAVPRVMRGEVVTDHDILTGEEMARAPFYNELLVPHGYHWFAVAGFHAGAEHWAVSVQRKARRGPFAAEQVRPLAGLARRLGQAATLWAELQAAYDRKEPVVLFNWTPNFIEAKFEGQFVEFPTYDPACLTDPKWGQNPDAVYDCGAPAKGYLKKAGSKALAEKWPAANAFLTKVNFSNPQIAAAAAMVDVDGMTPEDAAKKWIADNEATWKGWMN